jgi:phospholipase C
LQWGDATTPSTDSKGNFNGYASCEATYPTQRPTVPYGKQTVSGSLVSEQGFKPVRGQLTEGRYLTFEMNGYALTSSGGKLTVTATTTSHNTKAQRWVIHQVGGPQATSNSFTLSSAVDGSYLGSSDSTTYTASQAVAFNFVDLGNGGGFSMQKANTGNYYTISTSGTLTKGATAGGFKVFSVTYSN